MHFAFNLLLMPTLRRSCTISYIQVGPTATKNVNYGAGIKQDNYSIHYSIFGGTFRGSDCRPEHWLVSLILFTAIFPQLIAVILPASSVSLGLGFTWFTLLRIGQVRNTHLFRASVVSCCLWLLPAEVQPTGEPRSAEVRLNLRLNLS